MSNSVIVFHEIFSIKLSHLWRTDSCYFITNYRSSHQKCSMKKVFLRNFPRFTGKNLCQSLIFSKVAGLRHQACFFTEHFWMTASVVSNKMKNIRTPNMRRFYRKYFVKHNDSILHVVLFKCRSTHLSKSMIRLIFLGKREVEGSKLVNAERR